MKRYASKIGSLDEVVRIPAIDKIRHYATHVNVWHGAMVERFETDELIMVTRDSVKECSADGPVRY